MTPRRVGGLNIESTWSRSTAALVWPIGTVAPSPSVRREWPGSIARYFCPIAPFSRTVNVESTGSGPMLLLSLSASTAIGWPFGAASGWTLSTNPTSAPPMWTSAPWVSSLASATCTCSV